MALPSIKNCRLEESGRPVCYMRKVENNVLEIEAKGVLSEKCWFALGIASFLSSL
jgi:hypothetical protein